VKAASERSGPADSAADMETALPKAQMNPLCQEEVGEGVEYEGPGEGEGNEDEGEEDVAMVGPEVSWSPLLFPLW